MHNRNGVKFIHFTYQPILHILHFDSKFHYYICRTTQKEKQQYEMAQQTQAMQNPTPAPPQTISSVPVTPTVSTPVSSCQSTAQAATCPPNTSFETPHSTRHRSYATTTDSPASTMGSVDSILDVSIVSNSSGLRPEVNHMLVGRKRGKPHKIPLTPMYDDYPQGGTAEEKKRWQRHKNAEEWRHKKLMSADVDDYREKEKEHVSWYVSDKRQDLIKVAAGELSVYKHIKQEDKEMTPKSKVKEKSR